MIVVGFAVAPEVGYVTPDENRSFVARDDGSTTDPILRVAAVDVSPLTTTELNG